MNKNVSRFKSSRLLNVSTYQSQPNWESYFPIYTSSFHSGWVFASFFHQTVFTSTPTNNSSSRTLNVWKHAVSIKQNYYNMLLYLILILGNIGCNFQDAWQTASSYLQRQKACMISWSAVHTSDYTEQSDLNAQTIPFSHKKHWYKYKTGVW